MTATKERERTDRDVNVATLTAVERIAWRLRAVESRVRQLSDECRDRAHMAAGTHYASPRFDEGRRTFRGGLRKEAERAARRQLARTGPGRKALAVEARARGAKAGLGRFRRRPVRTVVRRVERVPYVGQAVTAVRVAFWSLLWCLLLLAVLWFGVLRPMLPGWAVSGLEAAPRHYNDLREFDRHIPPGQGIPGAPWHGLVPGSLDEQCYGVQPINEQPAQPKGGVEGVAWALGDRARRVLAWEPSAEAIRDALHSAAFEVGKGWAVFRRALDGAMPEPVQATPTHPVPQMPLGPGRIIGTPIAQGGEVQAFIAAVVEQESGGDYSAVGPPTSSGRAYGKYQILESNIGPWSEQYVGRRVTTQEFMADPNLQDQIAVGRLTDYYQQHGPRGAASAWYSGNPDLHMNTSPQQGGPSIKGYVDSVMRRMDAVTAACAPHAGGVVQAGLADPTAEAELSDNAARARRAVLAAFPGITIGGWGERPNNTEHDDRDPVTGRKAARALDVMNGAAMQLGRQVNAWLLANWHELRVGYVIWDRRIWFSPERSKPYHGRSPHTDHNHVTFLQDGEAL